ncbi:MAG: peptide chain release factor 1 [Candidatus Bipolaricaulota bacterium]|nr:peptide chain release factor 1 [Candidatus Bipolaricaulota bacterium]MDW8151437.1 peptide chain release factor 1 [Candidatus Bipolaricaulota bacterium]
MEKLLAKVAELARELGELERILGDPAAPTRPDFSELSRRYNRLRLIVEKGAELRKVLQNIAEEEQLLRETQEEELERALRQELERDRERAERLGQELRRLLVPPHPDDHKNAIVEIRAGAGGEEAALFAADLFRMYTKYAEKKGFRVRVLDSHPTDLGGFKQIVFAVEGPGAYGLFRYESGVHRVQRVPVTEASGRIHTSTATVAVLPEAEEVEVEIRPEDLKIETFRSSGPGGQHMQKNETAVRITHLPTGIVVTCQEERSQHRNKELALRVLRAKLRELEEQRKEAELQERRRRQIGTGERSEKIRTYNFPQNRVTDHRIDLTVYRLEDVLEGDLDLIVEPLLAEEAARVLAEG